MRFWRSFWGAERVYILIGSKVMIQNTNIFVSGFLWFCKKIPHLCNVFLWFLYFLHFCMFFHLCHNFWANSGIDLFSTSKWLSEPQFCEKYLCRLRKPSLIMAFHENQMCFKCLCLKGLVWQGRWGFSKENRKSHPRFKIQTGPLHVA